MDIKISLEIGLSPALEGFLAKVLGPQPRIAPDAPPSHDEIIARHGGQLAADIQAQIDEKAQGSQDEAPRKGRRTKAQIEADNAAQSAEPNSTTAASATDASADSQDQPASSPAQSDPTDLAQALGVTDEAPAAGEVTKADVQAKLSAVVGKLGQTGAGLKNVQDYMRKELDGATNMSSLDPKNYAKAIDLFDRLLADAA